MDPDVDFLIERNIREWGACNRRGATPVCDEECRDKEASDPTEIL
jgi:hypothetical protein